MSWLARKVLLTLILAAIGLFFFDTPHPEIGNNLNIVYPIIIGISIMLILHLVHRVFFSANYMQYKQWKANLPSRQKGIIIMPIMGWFVITHSILLSINQNFTSAPIETISSQVVDKYITSGKGGRKYCILINTPQGAIELKKENLYQMLDVGDNVTIKIQKGFFNSYFATQLDVEKNSYETPL